MSTNGFDAFTNFLKNVPPTKAVLVEESLTAIATIVRTELVSFMNTLQKSTQEVDAPVQIVPLALAEPQSTDAWIAHVRQAFHAHGAQIEALAAETPELSTVVAMTKYTMLAQAQAVPGTDQMIAYLERIIAYLEQSSAMLKDLGSLAKTVNAVMREHEE